MTDFTLATFNVKNLIGPEKEYYRFEQYTPEEYAWKVDWLADQVLTLNADIIGFQEIFEQEALAAVVAEADARGAELNAAVIPDQTKRYARKAIFRKLQYRAYGPGSLFWAPNSFDGEPGSRRPGLAILSRFGFEGTPMVIQDLARPLEIGLPALGGGEAGSFRLDRLSRPILKARIPVGGQVITVFNCHLKSKLGEYPRKEGTFAPEADLLNYDPVGRAIGEARAALRRMGEAVVMRQLVVDEIKAGYPTFVVGDFNDAENAVSSAIIAGERPFRNYAWLRRHDAKDARDRYSDEEDILIRGAIELVRLYSAEKLFVQKSLRDVVYSSAFGGVYESIDQILMSWHFGPGENAIGTMDYLSVLNDHLTDGSHPEAPYNKLASDHGQLMAHMKLFAE